MSAGPSGGLGATRDFYHGLLGQPAKLTDLVLSADDRSELRTEFRGGNERTLQHLVSGDILAAGETAIVPLSLYLSGVDTRTDPDELDFHSPLDLPGVRQKMEALESIEFFSSWTLFSETVPALEVAAALVEETPSAIRRNEYPVGLAGDVPLAAEIVM